MFCGGEKKLTEICESKSEKNQEKDREVVFRWLTEIKLGDIEVLSHGGSSESQRQNYCKERERTTNL